MFLLGGNKSNTSEVKNSLRLNGSNTYLAAALGTPTDPIKFTIHAAVKRGALGTWLPVYGCFTGSNAFVVFGFDSADHLVFRIRNSSGVDNVRVESAAVYRDAGAHYNVTLHYDSANAVASQRVRMFVDDAEVTTFSTQTLPPLNQALTGTTQTNPQIGRFNINGTPTVYHADGYIANYHYIDGQVLGPSYFGGVSASTGQWQPKRYSGSYGAIGFYLPFDDGASTVTLGADRSGNGNNWTLNNFVRAAGVTDCWMTDTPSNNYAVLNPLAVPSGTLSNANLTAAGGNTSQVGSIALPTTGKWYAEAVADRRYDSGANQYSGKWGITKEGSRTLHSVMYPATSGSPGVYKNGVLVEAVGGTALNDVLAFAFDADALTIQFYRNGAAYGSLVTLDAGVYEVFSFTNGNNASDSVRHNANFGQRSFAYTPPTGFKALCTKNLPAPSIKLPKLHFNVVTALGSGMSSAIAATGLSGLRWVKNRGAVAGHVLWDINRGASARLNTAATDAETSFDYADLIQANNHVGGVWGAGGAPVANNAGSIASQVSANVAAGFSIVTYTGTSNSADTVGHGLGVAPALVIVKARGIARSWAVRHAKLAAGNNLYLNDTGAHQAASATLYGGVGVPSSSTFGFIAGTTNASNVNYVDGNFVAYCFAEVPGYSKMGSYTGNGSADGPFVWCGFRPKWIMVKRLEAASYSWLIWDTARDTYNVASSRLLANTSDAEATGTHLIDALSNGFKLRNADANGNSSGGSYIFIAFAEAPFNYANAR